MLCAFVWTSIPDDHNIHRKFFFKGKEPNGKCRLTVTLTRRPVDRRYPSKFRQESESR